MAATKDEKMKIAPEEVFDWEVDALDDGLKELNVTIAKGWSKSRKAFELNKAILEAKPKKLELSNNSDPNSMMFQALQIMQAKSDAQLQAMQEQMRQDREAQAQAMV